MSIFLLFHEEGEGGNAPRPNKPWSIPVPLGRRECISLQRFLFCLSEMLQVSVHYLPWVFPQNSYPRTRSPSGMAAPYLRRSRPLLVPQSSRERATSPKYNSCKFHCGVELTSAQAVAPSFLPRASGFLQNLGLVVTSTLSHVGFNSLELWSERIFQVLGEEAEASLAMI